jgi:hypothetical protein
MMSIQTEIWPQSTLVINFDGKLWIVIIYIVYLLQIVNQSIKLSLP